MPIIVYKTLNITTVHAQVRRIVCEGCNSPFSYVTSDSFQSSTTGLPIVSSDEGMRKACLKQAVATLRKLAKKTNAGAALCPHCKVYQGFMTRSSFLKKLTWGLGLGIPLGAIGFGLFDGFVLGEKLGFGPGAGVGAILGAVAGTVLAKTFALSAGPHQDREDARGMTDDRFRELLAECAKEGNDPALVWLFLLGYQHDPKCLLISLGVEDRTGTPIAPPELLAEKALERLES